MNFVSQTAVFARNELTDYSSYLSLNNLRTNKVNSRLLPSPTVVAEACVKNSVAGGGMFGKGGVDGRGGHAWWWGCAWWGACVAGGGACMTGLVGMYGGGGGACMAGETATATYGTHPTLMHSCFLII